MSLGLEGKKDNESSLQILRLRQLWIMFVEVSFRKLVYKLGIWILDV